MTDADLASLTRLVLWASFALALLFGAIAQHTRFCTMGALADVVNIGDWSRLRMWMLAMGTAVLGFNALVYFGALRASDSIYAGPSVAWLSAIVGGGLFGVGMVLASGCASKNLVRAGGGSLKALVVLGVVAFAGFATLKGIGAVVRVLTVDAVHVDLASGQDLPSLVARLTGIKTPQLAGLLGLLAGGALVAFALASREARNREVLLGGFGIGALVVAAWWVSGVLGFVPEHPQTLEAVFIATNSRRMEAMSFVSAVAYASDYLLFFSDASKVATIGVVSALGLACGSAAYALATRTFRWEGFRTVEDLRNHLVGGALMGVGGVTGLGCTIGQGLSGLSTLSVASLLAVTSIVAGAVATLKFQAR
ncbi:MAG TPA: YeeE/YedE family protein [Albitalea sp.]|nr:YeeE/YedE family protein [Albitalea sp.]